MGDILKEILTPTKRKIIWSAIIFFASTILVPIGGFVAFGLSQTYGNAFGIVALVPLAVLAPSFFLFPLLGYSPSNPILVHLLYIYLVVSVMVYLIDKKGRKTSEIKQA